MTKNLTIKKEIHFSGVGVHSGKNAEIILQPSKSNSGISFIKENKIMTLDLKNIETTSLCTKLISGNLSIMTVEHLLSTINGLGITDINIFVNGDEIPILDGSCKNFLEKISPHIVTLNSDKTEIYLNKNIQINGQDKFLIAVPNDTLEVIYILEYQKFPYFMSYRFVYSINNFINEICNARTFGFFSDAEYLNKNGLALGSSYENTLVIHENYYSSELRYFNEPVRHKILDLIGDLAFLKADLKARIICYKTGHFEHLQLVENILKS